MGLGAGLWAFGPWKVSGTRDLLKQKPRGKKVWRDLGMVKAEFGQEILEVNKLILFSCLLTSTLPLQKTKKLSKAQTKQEAKHQRDPTQGKELVFRDYVYLVESSLFCCKELQCWTSCLTLLRRGFLYCKALLYRAGEKLGWG